MPLSGIWNELKKESACKKFELRGTEDIWGIYCTTSDNISDPDFSQKCKGKTESELKKALRLRCKQLMASDHGNIEIYRHILSLKECGGQHKEAQKFLDKHLARAMRIAPPIEKEPLSIKPPSLTMFDVPFEAYERNSANKFAKWNPMYPAETWTGPKLRSYFNCLNKWVVKQKKDLALVPRVLQIVKVGEYDYNHSCYDDIKGAIFNVYFEHPFSKVVLPVIMSEEEIREIQSYDPWYSIHYKNLQEETPINRAQDTYLSNCRKKDKAREERKRIEKEQAYIDAGSWDNWDNMEEENEKERVKEQTRLDRKRKQEIKERAAKREALRQASTTRIPPSPVRE